MSTEPKPAPARPRKKRRALRIALYVLGTPLVLAGLLLAYLHTGSGKARVRAAVLDRLRERAAGQVDLGVVDYAIFGEVKLADLRVRDPQGNEAVALASLTVRPSWSDLLRGRVVLSRVALSGLAVHVIKDAAGGSNLRGLLRPRPEGPQAQGEPFDGRIDIQSVSMDGIAVDVLQPGGGRIVLSDVALEGALSVAPASKRVDVEIGKIALSALVDGGKDGLGLGVTGVETGLTVDLDGGTGKATLHPLKGHVVVRLPGRAERGFDIALGGFSADVGEGGVGLSLDELLAGAVALASVDVKGRVEDGKMDGSQQADVIGLKVSGPRVNELLGEDVLLGDVDIETHVLGPPDKIAVATKIVTAGAVCSVDGAIGVEDPANPTYDVAVTLSDVDTEKVLAPALGIAPVAVEKVEATVKGRGAKVESAVAVARVELTGVTAAGVRVDGLDFEGELKDGVLQVRSVDAKALGQRVRASGEIDVATRRVDLTAEVEGDVGDVLARLRAAGLPVQSSLPRGAVRLPSGDLKITAKGHLGGALDVRATAKEMAVLGGRVGLDVRAALVRHDPPLPDGEKATVTAIDADLHVGGVRLSSILALRGKKLTGMEGTLSGDIHVEGTPESPRAKVLLGLSTARTDGGKAVRLSLTGDVAGGTADLKASLTPSGEAGEIFGLSAKLPLSLGGQKKGVDPYRPIEIHASLPKRTFADVWALLPDSLIPDELKAVIAGGLDLELIPGDLAATLDVKGTAAKPEGKLHVTVHAKAVPGFAETQKIDIDATLAPAGAAAKGAATAGLRAHADVGLWLDAARSKVVQIQADADVSRSPLLGPPDIAYHATATVGPVTAKDLFMVSPDDRATIGSPFASIDVKGDRKDLTAHVLVSADGVRPKGKGPLGVGAALDLGPEGTTIDVKLLAPGAGDASAKSPAAVLSGKIGLAGKGLFARLKEGNIDPSLDLVLDVPKRALASLAWLEPDLAGAPGRLSGSIPITGTVKAPVAKGSIVLTDVPMASGKAGGAVIALDARKDDLRATVGVGAADPAQAPLAVAVHVRGDPAARLADGAPLPVDVAFRAEKADIRQIVPAAFLQDTKVGIGGTLDWNMDVHASLAKADKSFALEEGSVKGLLDLGDATIALPRTRRVYRDVALRLAADEKGIHLDALRARESDLEERTLVVKGHLGLDELQPTTATLSVAADRWLVFGPRALGRPDAPRGTLTLAAEAKADFTQPIRRVSATVRKLDLLVPERFERAHQPEDAHAGDVVILGEDATPLGKLAPPRPARAAAPAKKGGASYDIDVHIAEGAHILQAPVELWPRGDISVKIRPTDRVIDARLDITRGGLSLGGADHTLAKGSVKFDKQHPDGWLDLVFERPMRPAALRQISEASGGTAVRIHMFGPLSDRKTVLSGAGTSGALWDVLSMHNVGRARHVSEPDLPWSMSTEFPQHDSLLVLGFMAVNLPHLLFLDRFAVWGDPYDDPRAYGRLTHFEAERFALGDALRFRVAARPPSAGQSEAEVELDYVLVNVPRMLLGVGVTGGTRGGGGPGIVWEWSSKD